MDEFPAQAPASGAAIALTAAVAGDPVALDLRSTCRKLNMASRTQVVRLALQLGWEE
ncbi:MAG: hypothetical protein ACKVOI_20540 [Dongiaceae bacterium]